jgi:hypothetical protein
MNSYVVAERPVVERQDIALRVEDVVLRGNRRPPEHASVRTVDPRFRRRQVERADVEVTPAALERFLREQRGEQPLEVAVELLRLPSGVALADDEQVHLFSRRSMFEDRPHRALLCTNRCRVDEARSRIDIGRPDRREAHVRLAFLERDAHGRIRPGESERLVEASMGALGFGRGFPLPIHG